MSPAAKGLCDHNYAWKPLSCSETAKTTVMKDGKRKEQEQKLREKIKNLQQKVRRSKKKTQTMQNLSPPTN